MTSKPATIEVSSKQFMEMKKQLDEMKNVVFGEGGKQPQLVKEIVTAVTGKIDNEQIRNMLVTLTIIGVALLVLSIVIIVIICIFQSQLADVSDLTGILP
jgi:undecaprenyl pyrophosphate phosphatase UppP